MNKIIMLIGLPGSGKSYFAKRLAVNEDAIIYSSDIIRQEMFDNINDIEHNAKVFGELYKKVRSVIKNNNVIIDATNISYKRRKHFAEQAKKYNCQIICYLIATPYKQCLENNKKRDRVVPEYAIKNMYKSFYIPQHYEGWDEINIIWNCNNFNSNINELFLKILDIEQDNPHHTLTIGKHCLKCGEILSNISNNDLLIKAGFYHDIGKLQTKEFKNSKGEKTEIAHYFQHHLVSAYESLFYLKDFGYEDEEILKITNYIQWHMQPFFIKTEKAKQKFINLVGEETYNNIMLLHEADKLAK